MHLFCPVENVAACTAGLVGTGVILKYLCNVSTKISNGAFNVAMIDANTGKPAKYNKPSYNLHGFAGRVVEFFEKAGQKILKINNGNNFFNETISAYVEKNYNYYPNGIKKVAYEYQTKRYAGLVLMSLFAGLQGLGILAGAIRGARNIQNTS